MPEKKSQQRNTTIILLSFILANNRWIWHSSEYNFYFTYRFLAGCNIWANNKPYDTIPTMSNSESLDIGKIKRLLNTDHEEGNRNWTNSNNNNNKNRQSPKNTKLHSFVVAYMQINFSFSDLVAYATLCYFHFLLCLCVAGLGQFHGNCSHSIVWQKIDCIFNWLIHRASTIWI